MRLLPETSLTGHVLEHLVLTQVGGAELGTGDEARDDVEPVRIAGCREQLFRLGHVVLVVLPAGAELFVTRVETPATGAGGERASPEGVDRQTLRAELGDVVEDVDI